MTSHRPQTFPTQLCKTFHRTAFCASHRLLGHLLNLYGFGRIRPGLLKMSELSARNRKNKTLRITSIYWPSGQCLHFAASLVICTQAKHKQIVPILSKVCNTIFLLKESDIFPVPTREENTFKDVLALKRKDPKVQHRLFSLAKKSEDEFSTDSQIPPEQRALYCISCLLAPVRTRDW